jgi:hypothetical protein
MTNADKLAKAIRDNGFFIDQNDDTIFLWHNRRWIVIGTEYKTVNVYPTLAVIRTNAEGDQDIRANCLGHYLGDGWAVCPDCIPMLRTSYPVDVLAVWPDTKQATYQVFDLAGCNEDRKLARLGFTHQVIGPDSEGGPVLVCACMSEETANAIRSALELVSKI